MTKEPPASTSKPKVKAKRFPAREPLTPDVLRSIAQTYDAVKKRYPHSVDYCHRELVRMTFQTKEAGWIDIEESDIDEAVARYP